MDLAHCTSNRYTRTFKTGNAAKKSLVVLFTVWLPE
jgi:hypothetical protein